MNCDGIVQQTAPCPPQLLLHDDRPAAEAAPEPTPAEAATRPRGPSGGAGAPGRAEGHPLRLHWDYLSYLFRRLPELTGDEELERGYRDFLQACTVPVVCHFVSMHWPPAHGPPPHKCTRTPHHDDHHITTIEERGRTSRPGPSGQTCVVPNREATESGRYVPRQ